MRKIRNSAIASAAAVSLIFGATTVAAADTANDKDTTPITSQDVANEVEKAKGNESPNSVDTLPEAPACNYAKKDGKLDEVIREAILNHNDPDCLAPSPDQTAAKTLKSRNSSAIGDATNADVPVTGKDLSGQHVNSSRQPAWSQIWIVGAALGVIGTVIGIGILPILNQLRAQGVIL